MRMFEAIFNAVSEKYSQIVGRFSALSLRGLRARGNPGFNFFLLKIERHKGVDCVPCRRTPCCITFYLPTRIAPFQGLKARKWMYRSSGNDGDKCAQVCFFPFHSKLCNVIHSLIQLFFRPFFYSNDLNFSCNLTISPELLCLLSLLSLYR